jgi:death-on-curing protein
MDLDPIFLEVDDVIDMHRFAIEEYSAEGIDGSAAYAVGQPWLLDYNLLESAVYAPRATMFGEYLHSSLAAMCASYWVALVMNHSFRDGNKRVGLLAAETFLRLNGSELAFDNDRAKEITLSIAKGELDRAQLEALLENHTLPVGGT